MENSTIALTVSDAMATNNTTYSTLAPEVTGPQDFNSVYNKHIHGYLCLFICMFGVLSNGLSVVVLTRPKMRSPTNLILAVIAFVDLVGCLLVIVVAIKFFIADSMYEAQCYSRHWMNLFAFNYYYYLDWIMTNIWLTLSMAVIRYIIVYRSSLGNFVNVVLMRHAVMLVVVVLIFSIFFNIPAYVNVPVEEVTNSTGCFTLGYDAEAFKAWEIAFEMFSVFPCIMLIVFSVLLILQIRRVKKRRISLTNPPSNSGKKNTFRWREENRTTWMLLAVVAASVITKMPWLLMIVIKHFSEYLKIPEALFNILYVLDYTNSAVNIIIYYRMSHQFRDAFSDLFFPSRFKTKRNITDADFNTTSYASNSV